MFFIFKVVLLLVLLFLSLLLLVRYSLFILISVVIILPNHYQYHCYQYCYHYHLFVTSSSPKLSPIYHLFCYYFPQSCLYILLYSFCVPSFVSRGLNSFFTFLFFFSSSLASDLKNLHIHSRKILLVAAHVAQICKPFLTARPVPQQQSRTLLVILAKSDTSAKH